MTGKGVVCLVKLFTPDGNEVKSVSKGRFTIGRSSESDVVCKFDGVSRQHLVVTVQDTQIYLEDLGSVNGTIVAGNKIAPKVRQIYQAGDLIHLGTGDRYITIELLGTRDQAGSVKKDLPEINIDQLLDRNQAPQPVPRPPSKVDFSNVQTADLPRKVAPQSVPAPSVPNAVTFDASPFFEEAKQKVRDAEMKAQVILERAERDAEALKRRTLDEANGQARNLTQEAETMRDSAKSEAERIRLGAMSEAEKVRKDAKDEALRIINQSHASAGLLKTEMEARAKQSMDEAMEYNRRVRMEAEVESGRVLTEASRLTEEMTKKAEAYVTDITKRAEAKAHELTFRAETQARELTERAHQEAQTLAVRAQAEATAVQRTSQERAESLISDATFKAREEIEKAKDRAAEIVKEAQSTAWTTIDQSQKRATTLTHESEARFDELKKLIATLGSRHEQDRSDFEAQRNRWSLELADLNRLVDGTKAQVAGLHEEEKLRRLDLEQTKQEHHRLATSLGEQLQSLTSEVDRLRIERDSLKAEVSDERSELQRVIKKKEESLRSTEELRQEREQLDRILIESEDRAERIVLEAEKKQSSAQKRVDHLNQEAESLQVSIARLKSDWENEAAAVKTRLEQEKGHQIAELSKELAAQRGVFEKELAERREQADREFGDRKAQEEKIIANLRAREVEDAKNRQREEDRISEEKRKLQVKEISRNLESLIGSKFAELGDASKLGTSFSGEVQDIVRRVIFEEYNADHDKLKHLMAFNPEAKIRRKNALKKKFYYGGALATFAVLYFVHSGFRDLINLPFVKLSHDRGPASLAVDRPKYNPPQTEKFKETFTDNVLYTAHYADLKGDGSVRDQWILDLNKFLVDQLRMDENAIVRIAAIETRLIKGLVELKSEINPKFEQLGLQRMKTLEGEVVKELKEALGSEGNFKAFKNFEQGFFESQMARKKAQSAGDEPDSGLIPKSETH